MTSSHFAEQHESACRFTNPVEEIVINPELNTAMSTKESTRWFLEGDYNEAAQEIYDKELDRICIAKRVSENFQDALNVAGVMETLAQSSYAVPRVYSVIKHKEDYWVVMEKINGTDLSEYCRDGGKLSTEQLLFIYYEISETSRILLENGVHHGDLRAKNIVLDSNHKGYPRLIDFDASIKTNGASIETVNKNNQIDTNLLDISNLETVFVTNFIRDLSHAVQRANDPELRKYVAELTTYLLTADINSFAKLSDEIRNKLGYSREMMERIRDKYFDGEN